MARRYGLPPEAPQVWGYYTLRAWQQFSRYVGLFIGYARHDEEVLAAVASGEGQVRLDRWLESAQG